MADDSTLQGIMRGSFWLFVGVAVFNVVGFIYWVIASLYVSPDVVGSASAILSFESLIINVFSLGIPIGIRRFFGSSWGEGSPYRMSMYLSTSIAFSVIVNIPALILVLAASVLNISILNLGQLELSFAVILMALDFWPSIFASLFISILRTKATTVSNSVSSIVKVLVGVLLLHLGYGFVGIMISVIVASLTRGVILLVYAIRLSKEIGFSLRPRLDLTTLKELLGAGVASWVPNTLNVLGQTLGVLLIYGFAGKSETGLYHIAFAISLVVYNLPGSIQSLMFPVLSGMDKGKENAATDAIRLSLAIASPLALILMVYPHVPFLLLGSSYADAASILAALMVGLTVFPIVSGYSSYVYALGKYTHVVAIDLVSTLVRLLLYFLLVVPFGGFGAAVAYVLGIVAAVPLAIISAHHVRFSFKPKAYAKTLLVPISLSLVVLIPNLSWFLGVISILFLTTVTYTRTGVITKNDVNQMALAFLSPESVARVHTHAKRIVMVLFGD